MMTTYRVLVAGHLSEDGLAILRAAPELDLAVLPQSYEALKPHLADADAIIVGDDLKVDATFFDAAPRLSLLARVGSSLTNIDVDEATRRGIIVMIAPGVDAVTVAEYTFTLILALARNVFGAHHDLLDGTWNQDAYIGTQLQGKTLGIIGYGRVGREVASRAIAFGLDVLVTDPYVPESQVAGLRLKLVGLDEIFRRSDIISLHTSVLPETRHLINAQSLAQMKRGVFIVNVKDSHFVDFDALRAALDSGQVAGAAIDDLGGPDQLKNNPLIGHPRVIHTQRMRFNTYEARRELGTLLAPQVVDALRKRNYRNAVNMPFMPGREYDAIEPQLKLGEKIGLLQHYLGHQAPIQRVEVSIQGEEMQGLLKPLTVAILYGMLSPILGERVNYINAPVVAAERGIVVTQSKGLESNSYPNLLTCRVLWEDGGDLIVAGAIFNHTEPRIVQVDQYRTDFMPTGTFLIMGSYDVPGVIGKVGTYMADHGINIAGWRTSRVTRGGNTLSVISIDDMLSDELLAELRSFEFVRHATQIVL